MNQDLRTSGEIFDASVIFVEEGDNTLVKIRNGMDDIVVKCRYVVVSGFGTLKAILILFWVSQIDIPESKVACRFLCPRRT